MPKLTILSTDVSCHCQKWTLLGMAKFSGREASLTKQTARPSNPMGLSVTSLPAEMDGTADGTVSEGAKRGFIFPTSSPSTQRAHNSHITSNKIFFSSFQDVDLLHSMLANCCTPRRQEWGTMAAVGGRWPPWFACVFFV